MISGKPLYVPFRRHEQVLATSKRREGENRVLERRIKKLEERIKEQSLTIQRQAALIKHGIR